MSSQPAGLKAILPLFLVIFIDSLGMGIIFPILNSIYMSPTGILPPEVTIPMRNFLYGLTLAVFPIGMFFGVPILGDLSDHVGRKKVLLLCLCGVGTSYIISAIAIPLCSVVLLILSRIIGGAFAGSIAIAQAAVIDVTPADKKNQSISIMLLPATLGFIVGPLGSFLTDKNLVSWFGLWTPLLLAGFLALANALLLYSGFQETYVKHGRLVIKLHRGIEIFIDAFRDKRIRFLSLMYFFQQLGWGIYFQFIGLYMVQKFHYGNNELGLFMAVLAMGFALAFIWVIHWVVKYLNNNNIVFWNLMLTTIVIFFVVISAVGGWIWLLSFIIALAMALAYSTTITLYSDLVGPEHQGWIMGISNAVFAAGWAVTAIGASFLQSWHLKAPLIAATVFFGLSTLVMYVYKKRR